MNIYRILALTSATTILTLSILGCTTSSKSQVKMPVTPQEQPTNFYGTLNPYAAESIYFLLTDRFVDGDKTNNHEQQGGKYPSFNVPINGPEGQLANVGYLGGDFKGVLNNAEYISNMGFTSVWLTPIYDNPDQAFSGGEKVAFGEYYKDGGKTGYHGYWANNFYEVDEHLPSIDLSFSDFTTQLKEQYKLNFVLDIVANHGSPSYSMVEDQPKFGEIYDQEGKLIADHQNIHPEKLDPNNPMHSFFNTHTGLAQLSDLNENNEAVLDYFEGAYLKWIEQGAHALRVDTIKEMPHHFWKKLFDRIRVHHPEIFIFGESYSYEAEFIAEHTRPENGGASVLDFPGRKAITTVFENADSDFDHLLSYLHLDDGVYQNPYELMTFYDNHDMERMNASDEGFIDANNWLFTSRGIPVVYYGSEINFMTGQPEHKGNRNYLGQQRIEQAKKHTIHNNLTTIAHVRKESVALQRGLQVNLDFKGDLASFYRVYQNNDNAQTALVLLNKGESKAEFSVQKMLSTGLWTDAVSGEQYNVNSNELALNINVKGHGVKVLLLNTPINNDELLGQLVKQQHKLHEVTKLLNK